MSSIPGFTLEDFVEWNHNGIIFPELLVLYEPHRETIEWWLDQFDDNEHNWRDYAGACPSEPTDDEIKKVMDEYYGKS